MNTVRYIGQRQFQVGCWIADSGGMHFQCAHGDKDYIDDLRKAMELCNFLNGGSGIAPESLYKISQ